MDSKIAFNNTMEKVYIDDLKVKNVGVGQCVSHPSFRNMTFLDYLVKNQDPLSSYMNNLV